MRQLAERYVCDRGRLVVECLSCGKRKEDAAEESNPAGYGSAFLVPAVRDRLRHRPWQPKQHPTHRKSGDCSNAKDDPICHVNSFTLATQLRPTLRRSGKRRSPR